MEVRDTFIVVTEAPVAGYRGFRQCPDGMYESQPLVPDDADTVSRHLREHYPEHRHGWRDSSGRGFMMNLDGSATHTWDV